MTVINPLTGDQFTEAEAARTVARFAEANRLWAGVVTYARQAHSRIADPHERLMAIGVHVAGLIAAEVVSHDVPDPDGFTLGLMVGVLAVGADTVAGAP